MDDWYEPSEFIYDTEDEDVTLPLSEYNKIEEHVVKVYEQIKEYTYENEPLLLKYMDPSHLATFLYSQNYLDYISCNEEGSRIF